MSGKQAKKCDRGGRSQILEPSILERGLQDKLRIMSIREKIKTTQDKTQIRAGKDIRLRAVTRLHQALPCIDARWSAIRGTVYQGRRNALSKARVICRGTSSRTTPQNARTTA
jgi:hypothetical protein